MLILVYLTCEFDRRDSLFFPSAVWHSTNSRCRCLNRSCQLFCSLRRGGKLAFPRSHTPIWALLVVSCDVAVIDVLGDNNVILRTRDNFFKCSSLKAGNERKLALCCLRLSIWMDPWFLLFCFLLLPGGKTGMSEDDWARVIDYLYTHICSEVFPPWIFICFFQRVHMAGFCLSPLLVSRKHEKGKLILYSRITCYSSKGKIRYKTSVRRMRTVRSSQKSRLPTPWGRNRTETNTQYIYCHTVRSAKKENRARLDSIVGQEIELLGIRLMQREKRERTRNRL